MSEWIKLYTLVQDKSNEIELSVPNFFYEDIFECISDENIEIIHNFFAQKATYVNVDCKHFYWEKVSIYIQNSSYRPWLYLDFDSNDEWMHLIYEKNNNRVNLRHRYLKDTSLKGRKTLKFLEQIIERKFHEYWRKIGYYYMELSQNDVLSLWLENWYNIVDGVNGNMGRDYLMYPGRYEILKWSELNMNIESNDILKKKGAIEIGRESYIVRKSTWEVIRFAMEKPFPNNINNDTSSPHV